VSIPWHLDQETVSRYAEGELDEARAYSLEAHLLACGDCRALLAPVVDSSSMLRVWSEIEEVVDAPRPGLVERALIRVELPDHLSRLLAATPSLRLSWLGAVSLALAFAVLAAHEGHQGLAMFLAIAPLIPVAGVAAAFGSWIDPTYEIGVAAPFRSFRLLLLRSTAVLASSLVLIGLAALALPRLDWTAAAWLLPALALTSVTLAVSTVVEPVRSAVGVAVAWILGVTMAARLAGDGVAAFHETGQGLCVVLVAVAGLILARRSAAIDRRLWS
jgi:hypothetical protein